jgi:O-antigen ligase
MPRTEQNRLATADACSLPSLLLLLLWFKPCTAAATAASPLPKLLLLRCKLAGLLLLGSAARALLVSLVVWVSWLLLLPLPDVDAAAAAEVVA